MTNPDNREPAEAVDVEAEAAATATETTVTQKWTREDLIKKASPISRGLCLLFSLLAFIIMVSNQYGYSINFNDYEEYSYVLAISIISSLYSAWQTFVHLSKREFFDQRTSVLVDFAGDQIVAYLLISATSSAIPLTNYLRAIQYSSIFTDSAASSISMAFFAFISLAVSALFSGYKLSSHLSESS